MCIFPNFFNQENIGFNLEGLNGSYMNNFGEECIIHFYLDPNWNHEQCISFLRNQNMVLVDQMKDQINNISKITLFSKNVTIEINAEIGKLDYMQIPSWNYKIPYNYGITKEEARKTAFELFEKYKVNYEKQLEKYKNKKITEDEFVKWIVSQKGDLKNGSKRTNKK